MPEKDKRSASKRKPYDELRPREHLTGHEVFELMKVARARGRYGHRDATMILVAYLHALRVSTLCGLRWDQVDLDVGQMRLEGGGGKGRAVKHSRVHPITGAEREALSRLRREHKDSPYLFVTERGGPVTPAGFRRTLSRVGEASSILFPVHPQMLRHSLAHHVLSEGLPIDSLKDYFGFETFGSMHRYVKPSEDEPNAERDKMLVTLETIRSKLKEQDAKAEAAKPPEHEAGSGTTPAEGPEPSQVKKKA